MALQWYRFIYSSGGNPACCLWNLSFLFFCPLLCTPNIKGCPHPCPHRLLIFLFLWLLNPALLSGAGSSKYGTKLSWSCDFHPPLGSAGPWGLAAGSLRSYCHNKAGNLLVGTASFWRARCFEVFDDCHGVSESAGETGPSCHKELPPKERWWESRCFGKQHFESGPSRW